MPGDTVSQGRVRYSKVVRGALLFVIADIHPGGNAEFFSQEAGEVRWYPFVPAHDERSAALALPRVEAAAQNAVWPLLFAGEGAE